MYHNGIKSVMCCIQNYLDVYKRQDIDTGVRKKLFETFLVNASILGNRRRNKVKKENDCNAPWAILMDPTSACNLHCTGCWAADYGHQLSMSYEELDNIITQGKELGTYMYIYSGCLLYTSFRHGHI